MNRPGWYSKSYEPLKHTRPYRSHRREQYPHDIERTTTTQTSKRKRDNYAKKREAERQKIREERALNALYWAVFFDDRYSTDFAANPAQVYAAHKKTIDADPRYQELLRSLKISKKKAKDK